MFLIQNLICNSYHLDMAYKIDDSKISGKGVIAIKDLPIGCKGLAHVHSADYNMYMFSHLGYFINHSETANCAMISNRNFRYIETLKNINAGDELTCNYWHIPPDLEKPDYWEKYEFDKNNLRKYDYLITKPIIGNSILKIVDIQKPRKTIS